MRHLASIQTIKAVEPIENADFIELVHVLGWQCVAKKGEFKSGDSCVYFEIDSFLPIRPEFEFLRANSYKNSEMLGEGFRLKTQTFRGKISQGLCLPISMLGIDETLPEGTDVTELLGVRKWEIPETLMSDGTAIGELPGNVPHTDETRIQAMPELINEFGNKPYYISTKIDGSSHSISYDENGFHVMGHNYEYKPDDKCGFLKFIQKNYPTIADAMSAYLKMTNHKSIVIQGEFAGPGIQKNRLKLQNPAWYVFDIRVDERRLHLIDFLDLAKSLKLTTVPIEEVADNFIAHYPTVEALLERADGTYPNGGKKEGIVIRPTEPVYSSLLNTDLSMKVVNNKYLLKHGD